MWLLKLVFTLILNSFLSAIWTAWWVSFCTTRSICHKSGSAMT